MKLQFDANRQYQLVALGVSFDIAVSAADV